MKKNKRDDFTSKDKEILAKAVNYRCSNPDCQVLTTTAKSNDHNNITNIGQAAHITAASKGGPRYDESLSPKDRASISNGIWLCSNCASLIDREPDKYTAELLKEWKEKSCEDTRSNLGKKQNPENQNKLEKIDLILDYVKSISDDGTYVTFKKIDKKRIDEFIINFHKCQKKPLINCIIPFCQECIKTFELADTIDMVEKKYAIKAWQEKMDKIQETTSSLLGFILDDTFREHYHFFMGSHINKNNLADLVHEALEYSLIPSSSSDKTKINVWRTTPDYIQAPIYLEKDEIKILLNDTKLEKIEYLGFGANWRDLGDILDNRLKNKTLAAICCTIIIKNLHNKLNSEEISDLFFRYQWHIGLE
ncbi:MULTISPECIES: hypothetical protein [Haemophilus]|nr:MULTISPECIES: hypothetical protein [Haemophilus]